MTTMMYDFVSADVRMTVKVLFINLTYDKGNLRRLIAFLGPQWSMSFLMTDTFVSTSLNESR